MKRKDLAIIAAVVATVVVVAAWQSNRDRGARAASPAQALTVDALPRLVDLGAGRCIPCKKMAPILAELRSEYAGRAEVVFIDVWEQTDLADQYSFRAIPTQIFYARDGTEVWRHEGFLDKPEIVAQFRRMGVE